MRIKKNEFNTYKKRRKVYKTWMCLHAELIQILEWSEPERIRSYTSIYRAPRRDVMVSKVFFFARSVMT